MGESGAGKSTLVRAMSGLSPWGAGEILIKSGATLLLIPQQPYVPLGTLRRAATYPSSPDEGGRQAPCARALEEVGLGDFVDRLDEETRWADILSGGEKQRLSFAPHLLHRPDLIVMDEVDGRARPATEPGALNEDLPLSGCPKASADQRRPPRGARGVPPAEAASEYHPEGARLVRDETLQWSSRRSARVLARLLGG